MSTIIDIARLAGVSKSTVSRVLTGSGYVSAETKARIEQIMEEQGFQPSSSARTLSTSKTNTIGVIVPEISNPFYSEILEGIARVVDERDLTIIYCNTDNDACKEEKALRMLIGQQVSGMIYAPAVDYAEAKGVRQVIALLRKISAPVVLLDRELEGSGLDSIIYDNYGAGYAATEALIKGGNRTVGCITGDMKLKIARDRYNGYISAMYDYGLPVDQKYVRYGDFGLETAYRLSRALYASGDVPEGLLTCNNRMTLGLLRATTERGMQFGREIACVGIDHVDVLDWIGYQYSCVDRDVIGMGRRAMELLLARMEKPEMGRESVIIPYEVKLRGGEKRDTARGHSGRNDCNRK